MQKPRYAYDRFKEIKSQVYLRDKVTCQKCGKTIGDKSKVNRFGVGYIEVTLVENDFVIHHLDHNSYNNNLSNLVLWCDRCHHSHHGRNPKLPTLTKWLK